MHTEAARSTLSMYSMFAESDLFMKLLILGLLFASFWCWAIIFDKIKLLRKIRTSMKAFEEKLIDIFKLT